MSGVWNMDPFAPAERPVIAWVVELEFARDFMRTYGAWVRKGGMFLPTEAVFAPGDEVDFEVKLKSAEVIIKGTATVRWCANVRRNPFERTTIEGIGVQFKKLHGDSTRLIEVMTSLEGSFGATTEPPTPEEIRAWADQHANPRTHWLAEPPLFAPPESKQPALEAESPEDLAVAPATAPPEPPRSLIPAPTGDPDAGMLPMPASINLPLPVPNRRISFTDEPIPLPGPTQASVEAIPLPSPDAPPPTPGKKLGKKERRAAREAERKEAERIAAERVAAERREAERAAQDRKEAERVAAERAAMERKEAERVAAERAAIERREAERLAAERASIDRKEAERGAIERKEAERVASERAAMERKEAQRVAAERAASERRDAERKEAERRHAERVAAERAALERAASERAALERAASERAALERAAAERAAGERKHVERAAAERREEERRSAERAATARTQIPQFFADSANASLDLARAEIARLQAAVRLEEARAETARAEAARAEATARLEASRRQASDGVEVTIDPSPRGRSRTAPSKDDAQIWYTLGFLKATGAEPPPLDPAVRDRLAEIEASLALALKAAAAKGKAAPAPPLGPSLLWTQAPALIALAIAAVALLRPQPLPNIIVNPSPPQQQLLAYVPQPVQQPVVEKEAEKAVPPPVVVPPPVEEKRAVAVSIVEKQQDEEKSKPPRARTATSGGVTISAVALAKEGDAALRAGKIDDAMSAFTRALQLDPRYPPAHRGMGAVLTMQGKDAEAAASYRKYLTLAPNATDRGRIEALLEE